jgi:hypothetical protein
MLGKQLKEIGQQKALFNAGDQFLIEAHNELIQFIRYRKAINQPEFRMEEFRSYCEQIGIDMPKPQVWGGFTAGAVKKGLIFPTGRYQMAESPKTHAHVVALWIAI